MSRSSSWPGGDVRRSTKTSAGCGVGVARLLGQNFARRERLGDRKVAFKWHRACVDRLHHHLNRQAGVRGNRNRSGEKVPAHPVQAGLRNAIASEKWNVLPIPLLPAAFLESFA